MLTDEERAEFKRLWKEEFGEELNDAEVLQEAPRLLELTRFLELKPP